MARRTRVLAGIVLLAALAGTGLATAPAQAARPYCTTDPEDHPCGGGTGGGGGTPPVYTLQGVIQHDHDENAGVGRRAVFRAYSRLADSGNNRVDADYINVRCYAYDQLGGYTTDYDSENNGALVDVTFASNSIPGALRTITVNCTHYAEKNGTSYNTTSTMQYSITY
ncbi:hypothetical protein OG900_09235 [Streptomyces sp. NBC_00433]